MSALSLSSPSLSLHIKLSNHDGPHGEPPDSPRGSSSGCCGPEKDDDGAAASDDGFPSTDSIDDADETPPPASSPSSSRLAAGQCPRIIALSRRVFRALVLCIAVSSLALSDLSKFGSFLSIVQFHRRRCPPEKGAPPHLCLSSSSSSLSFTDSRQRGAVVSSPALGKDRLVLVTLGSDDDDDSERASSSSSSGASSLTSTSDSGLSATSPLLPLRGSSSSKKKKKKKKRPLVILFGWLGARAKDLSKYAEAWQVRRKGERREERERERVLSFTFFPSFSSLKKKLKILSVCLLGPRIRHPHGPPFPAGRPPAPAGGARGRLRPLPGQRSPVEGRGRRRRRRGRRQESYRACLLKRRLPLLRVLPRPRSRTAAAAAQSAPPPLQAPRRDLRLVPCASGRGHGAARDLGGCQGGPGGGGGERRRGRREFIVADLDLFFSLLDSFPSDSASKLAFFFPARLADEAGPARLPAVGAHREGDGRCVACVGRAAAESQSRRRWRKWRRRKQ